MSNTFMKEESKDLFYGQFENVKSEKLDYDMKPMFEHVPFPAEVGQSDSLPLTLSINYSPYESSSADLIEERRFYCQMCEKSFKYKSGLTDHMKRKHSECPVLENSVVVDFDCNICSKSFGSSHALHRHILTHTTQEVPCRKQGCTQMFASESEMRSHIEQEHLDKKYRCRVCSKMFTRVSNLNRHMKLHQNIREFPCTLCGKEFTQRVHRDKHMMIHFRTSNQCPKCAAVYTKLKYFSNHVTNVCFNHNTMYNPPSLAEAVVVPYTEYNSNTYTLKCPICSVGQKDSKKLRGHIINVHHVDNICPQCNTKHDQFDEFVEHLRECYREDKETSSMLADFANSLLDSFQFS